MTRSFTVPVHDWASAQATPLSTSSSGGKEEAARMTILVELYQHLNKRSHRSTRGQFGRTARFPLTRHYAVTCQKSGMIDVNRT